MFDYVDFVAKCPNCKRSVTGFQSKDGPCNLLDLKPWEVEHFYTSCSCGAWISFMKDVHVQNTPKRIPPPEPPGWLENYKCSCTVKRA